MADKTRSCSKCIHLDVCKTADSCDGYVSNCKRFKSVQCGMSNYSWPVTLLEKYKIPAEIMMFFQGFVDGSEDNANELEELYSEHQLLKDTSAKQDRYIAELEKQLSILQKTLDLIDMRGEEE